MSQNLPINNHQNRVKLSDALPLDTPFSVFVFPTTYCNFRCVYCAHSMDAAEMEKHYGLIQQTMDMDTYCTVIQQLRQFPRKIKLLSLTGQGEPLMNKQLPEMVRYAREAEVAERIEIITNGSLLTPELSDALIAAGLDGLRISMQGLDCEKYAAVCGRPIDFDQFIQNIRYFYQHKGQCDLFVKIMDSALDEGQDQDFYRILDPISDRMYIERCRPVYDGVEFTASMNAVAIDRYGNEHPPRKVCPLSFFMLSVFPDGDVEPCDSIYKPVILGNVHTNTLREMFLGETLKEFQRQQLAGRRYDNKKCAVCCAPDDVSHPLDVLDDSAEWLLDKLYGGHL